MKKVELLSPAGNMECLISAVLNGADAVYVGGKKFGARHFAQNFDYDEMIEAIKYCHLYGVKIYVTVNTICYEEELEEAINYVEFLYDNHVDALIMQDLGLISIVREKFPNLEIHASTQAHNHNDDGLSLLKNMGIKRAVLAREMTLEEIKNIKTDIDLEVFIHGALCVSYSGCCLFSSMHGGRSGNRGECTGCCRLPYKLYENEKEVKTNGNYLLSTKSLCTINKINKIIESGVTSLKIEGRMKSKEYVGYITKIYRKAIDDYYQNKRINITDEEIKNIKKLYNRELTEGYLFDNYGSNLMNIKSSNHIGINLGKVLYIDRKKIKIKLNEDLYQEDGIRFDNDKGMIVNMLYNEKGLLVNKLSKGDIAIVDNKIGLKHAKIVRKTTDTKLIEEINKTGQRKVNISLHLIAKIGRRLQLTIKDEKNEITRLGEIVQQAEKSKTEYERIKSQIEKLGNTPFKSIKTEIEMDENIFVSIKELNELRRELTDLLAEKRKFSSPYNIIKNEIKLPVRNNFEENLNISILVRNTEQLEASLELNINNIYVTNYSLYKKYKNNKNIYYRTKRVSSNDASFINENLLATELGAASKYSKSNNVIGDYFLNVVNSATINKLFDFNLKRVTLSPELNEENVKLLGKIPNIDLYIYGRVELMILKYCPMNMLLKNDSKNCNLCDINKYYLEDKDNNKYPIENEKHLTHILDNKNIDLLDKIDKYMDYGFRGYRIDLYDETKEELKNIISIIRYAYEHRNNK